MIRLSVIIVNYNVRHFLEQCLLSVQTALQGLEGEIIVVDNNSTDDSVQMVKDAFGTDVRLIENQDNPGFSKANNQGIQISRGEYVLLLNPDTVVPEDTFQKCLAFLDAHPDAGALGVKMIDGEGNFLPESKRGLPTPWVSFYKIFGFSALFPKSRLFGKYHLSYLDPGQSHEVEVLSGAFMLMRRTALDKAGLLDEDFFMYGEDIDLSYRIILAGYKNYYLPDARIIHYKGESTKKGSLNYVRVFYQAMIIFAQKHFGGNRKRLFIAGIRLAVYFRAALAVFSRLIRQFGFPLLEAGLVYATILGVKAYWEHYVKFIEGGEYPPEFDFIAAPVYTIVFISLLGMMGAYRKPFRIPPIIMATLSGFIAIATVSYIVPSINFSRAIVGLSSVFTMIIALTTRGILNLREKGTFFFTEPSETRLLLAGNPDGVARVATLLRTEMAYPGEIVGAITDEAGQGKEPGPERLGGFAQLQEIVRYYDIGELVFAADGFPAGQVLDQMENMAGSGLAFRIVPPQRDFLVGSQYIHTSRYHEQIHFALSKRDRRIKKRLFDLLAGTGLLLSFPLLFWRYEHPARIVGRILKVLTGRMHLIGYIHPDAEGLPRIRSGLLNMLHRTEKGTAAEGLNTVGLDRHYARSYSPELDLEILWKSWRKI